MDGTSVGVKEQITAAGEQLRAAHEAINAVLNLARETEATERELGPVMLQAAELVGWSEQAHEGELVQLLAEAHRFKASRGGSGSVDRDASGCQRGCGAWDRGVGAGDRSPT